MFQIVFVVGVLSGGYVVHRVHSTLNKKPLTKLKNKIVATKEDLKEKWEEYVEKRRAEKDAKND